MAWYAKIWLASNVPSPPGTGSRKARRAAVIAAMVSARGSFPELTKAICPALKRGAVLTDVGSVKGSMVHELEGLMPPDVYLVGAHPIAGSDRSGIDFCDPALFSGALCIITPSARTEPAALSAVTEIWNCFGAKVMTMDPDRHDRVYAAVSHLPHIIAYAMVNTVADIDRSFLSYCGQGFRDMTRIAASSAEIWTDISLLNRENIREMIAVFRNNLDRMDAHLKTSKADELKEHFARASTTRKSIGQD